MLIPGIGISFSTEHVHYLKWKTYMAECSNVKTNKKNQIARVMYPSKMSLKKSITSIFYIRHHFENNQHLLVSE